MAQCLQAAGQRLVLGGQRLDFPGQHLDFPEQRLDFPEQRLDFPEQRLVLGGQRLVLARQRLDVPFVPRKTLMPGENASSTSSKTLNCSRCRLSTFIVRSLYPRSAPAARLRVRVTHPAPPRYDRPMPRRRPAILLLAFAAAACASPPAPAPAPAAPEVAWVGREPASPPGTEGLHAAPCSSSVDLSTIPAAARAFDPGGQSLSGRTTLPFHVRGPARRWTWSSSRPAALRFEEGAAGEVTLIAGAPGTTLVRLTVGDEAGDEAATARVSVPFFVRVRADGDFAGMLDRELGLGGRAAEVMVEARRVIDAIYARVNVRVAFEVGLGEALPDALPPGGFVEATLHGDLHGCVTPGSSLLYTEFGGHAEGDGGRRLVLAPVHVCPGIFARHPDTMAEMVKRRARLLGDARGGAMYVTVVGRALGELLAHEIGHQLLGCDNRGERRLWRCHDRLPRSLMNKAGERSFADRTGIAIVPTAYASAWRDDFPAPGTYEDRGVSAVNGLPPDGQAVLDGILPVPPTLGEEAACP